MRYFYYYFERWIFSGNYTHNPLVQPSVKDFIAQVTLKHQSFSKCSNCFARTEKNLGGRIIWLLKENYPEKVINSHKFPFGIEMICIEFNICDRTYSFFLGYTDPPLKEMNSSPINEKWHVTFSIWHQKTKPWFL